MDISEVVNIILSGDLVGTVAAIGSLCATARRAKVEASKSEADVETAHMDNAESATRILMESIVKPLKNESNETKEELSEAKKELARNTREVACFRKALDGTNGCEHRDDCPILDRLYGRSKECNRERSGTGRGKRQHHDRNASYDGTAGAKVGSEPDPEYGQPP